MTQIARIDRREIASLLVLPLAETDAPPFIAPPFVSPVGRPRRRFRAFVKSAAKLCGGLALIGVAVLLLRLPDAELMRHVPLDPTVTGTRDGLLITLAWGAGLVLIGVGGLRKFVKPTWY